MSTVKNFFVNYSSGWLWLRYGTNQVAKRAERRGNKTKLQQKRSHNSAVTTGLWWSAPLEGRRARWRGSPIHSPSSSPGGTLLSHFCWWGSEWVCLFVEMHAYLCRVFRSVCAATLWYDITPSVGFSSRPNLRNLPESSTDKVEDSTRVAPVLPATVGLCAHVSVCVCVCISVADTPPGVWLCSMRLDVARFLRR